MRWGRQGNPSSHWTIGLANQWYFVALAFITLFHFFLAAWLPLSEDEIYFWTWSQNWQLSYFDHPPMVAYLMGISTAIFGNNPFGIRFFAVILSSLVLVIIGKITEEKVIPGFLLFSPVFFLGGVLMTPDNPMLFFWSLYLLWFIWINRTLSQWSGDPITRVYRSMPVGIWSWALGGAILGLGFVSKYTSALLYPCTLLFLLANYRIKGWIKGFIVLTLAAGVVTSGILIFNIQNDFAPFLFQVRNAFSRPGNWTNYFGNFIGSQLLMVGLLPFLSVLPILVNARDLARDPRLNVCIYFFLPPFFFFLFQAMRSYIEGNWALGCYVALWPLAQTTLQHGLFRFMSVRYLLFAFLIPLCVSALVLTHLFVPLKWIPIGKDRVYRLGAQEKLYRTLVADLKKITPLPQVYATSYQSASFLQYEGVTPLQPPGYGRISTFNIGAKEPCEFSEVIFVSEQNEAIPPSFSCFTKNELLLSYDLYIREEKSAVYQVRRFQK